MTDKTTVPTRAQFIEQVEVSPEWAADNLLALGLRVRELEGDARVAAAAETLGHVCPKCKRTIHPLFSERLFKETLEENKALTARIQAAHDLMDKIEATESFQHCTQRA